MKKVWQAILLGFSVIGALCAFAACKKDSAAAPSHQHTFAHYIEREATCSQKGMKEHLECLICNKLFSDDETRKEVSAEELEIACLPHTEAPDEAIEATCTENGRAAGKHCLVCNTVLEGMEVIPASHKDIVTDEAVAATCTEDGKTEGKHCSVCNTVTVKQVAVSATGHTEAIDAAVEPTCTKEGKTAGKHCSVCNTVLVAQEVIPASHKDIVTDEAVAATCTKTGKTEGKHCSVCKTVLEEQKETPVAEHTEVIDEAVAATCTENGLTEGKHCSVCDTVIIEQEAVPVALHTWGDKVCTVCGVDFYTEGLKYELSKDGNSYSLSGIGTASGNIVVPAVYLGKPVTEIARLAFSNSSKITGITIPNSVTSIGHWAFAYCNFTNLTVPKSVTNIDKEAFAFCHSMSIEVESGNTVYYVENNCLIETATKTLIWGGRKNCAIPADVINIGNYAFYCSDFTEFMLPSGLKSIGDQAFNACYGITNLTIPSSVTKLGKNAFYDLGLTSITVDSENTVYRSENNCLIETATKTLLLGCRNSVIPDSVTTIGDRAFYRCAPTSVTIPNGVTSIGIYAFQNSSIMSLTIPSSVTSIGAGICYNTRNLSNITVESGNPKYHSKDNCLIETATNTLILGCKDSVIPADGSVTHIGDSAFWECSELTSITIPDGVTSIEGWAFCYCYYLTEITIPNSVTSIGNCVFKYCSKLKSINFEGTIEKWNAVRKGINWNDLTGDYTVYCSDGKLDKNGNEID